MTQALVEQKIEWSKDLKSLYGKYPSIIRSKQFPEIQRLVNSGDYDGGEAIAKQIQARNPKMRIENIIARRMRIERASLFTRLSQAERQLRVIFNRLGTQLAGKVERKAEGTGALPHLYGAVHETAVELGRELRKWINAVVRDSATMALKNAGNAFLPIFKDNWESVLLREDKLSINLDKTFANRTDPRVGMGSVKWKDKVTNIVKGQARKNITGQNYSEKIWELQGRAEAQMKRLLANEIANGTSPNQIARKIEKYLSPSITQRADYDEILPRGVYQSPFKNAWRLARTEAGKAYTNASAQFAKDKKWITGVRITLSPAHEDFDDCDELAQKGVITPEEFEELIPAHPHCMCYPTYVIDDNFLASIEDEDK